VTASDKNAPAPEMNCRREESRKVMNSSIISFASFRYEKRPNDGLQLRRAISIQAEE
jgi:hypothetical protein